MDSECLEFSMEDWPRRINWNEKRGRRHEVMRKALDELIAVYQYSDNLEPLSQDRRSSYGRVNRAFKNAFAGVLSVLFGLLPTWGLAQAVNAQAGSAGQAPSSVQTTLSAQRHSVALLDEHSHALQARLDAIDRATHSIDLSTFIIEPDPVALDILWHLQAAAARGVRVRMLLDAQFNRLPRPMVAQLVASGVEIRQYHPFRWYKPGWINTRLHDKMLLTDTRCDASSQNVGPEPVQGSTTALLEANDAAPQADPATMIVGGRNMSQPYFGFAGRLPRAYVDRDIQVTGPATTQGCQYFQELWRSKQTRFPRLGRRDPERTQETCERHPRISRGGCRRELIRRDREFAETKATLLEAHTNGWHPSPSEPATVFVVGSVEFLADPVGDKDFDFPIINRLIPQPDRIGAQLQQVLERAETSVVIESPYMVPSRGFRKGIESAMGRGVAFRVLTNSLLTTDNLLPQAAYRNAQGWILGQGIELWEYAGAESMHAKSAVLDERIGIVGSYNLDPRSEHLNTEIALVIDDGAFATALLASMDRRLEQSWHITHEGIANLAPGSKRYPGVTRRKILLMTLLRGITPFFRRQL